jgi:hypothetical protein
MTRAGLMGKCERGKARESRKPGLETQVSDLNLTDSHRSAKSAGDCPILPGGG